MLVAGICTFRAEHIDHPRRTHTWQLKIFPGWLSLIPLSAQRPSGKAERSRDQSAAKPSISLNMFDSFVGAVT
jgi:hypothetical protein